MNVGQATASISTSSARVYDIYDAEDPPSHPGDGWTRFICISDTHSSRFPVPDGDVLLHSGDLSAGGGLHAFRKTIVWLKELKHPAKVIIAGNHDLCLDQQWKAGGRLAKYFEVSSKDYNAAHELVEGEAARQAGIHYLQHSALDLPTSSGRTWKIYGSPSAPVYSEGAFQYATNSEARNLYSRIPEDVEILLTHTPAHQLLDSTRHGKQAGCPVLAKALNKLPGCRLHVFGHIHESHGALLVAPSKPDDANGKEPVTGDAMPRVEVNAALDKRGAAIIVDLRN